MLETMTEESLTLRVADLNHSHILRAFDELRRRLARRLPGGDGFFPGYDAIELRPVPSDECAAVVCTARVTRAAGKMQDIAYTAVLVDDAGRGAAASGVISRAAGRTIANPSGPRDDPSEPHDPGEAGGGSRPRRLSPMS